MAVLSSSEINPRSPVRNAAAIGPVRGDIAARMRSLAARRISSTAVPKLSANVCSRTASILRTGDNEKPTAPIPSNHSFRPKSYDPGATGAGSGRNVARTSIQSPGDKRSLVLAIETRTRFGVCCSAGRVVATSSHKRVRPFSAGSSRTIRAVIVNSLVSDASTGATFNCARTTESENPTATAATTAAALTNAGETHIPLAKAHTRIPATDAAAAHAAGSEGRAK